MADSKVDKLKAIREQSLVNNKSKHHLGKQKEANKDRVAELKGNKNNKVK